jgi:hypothetical protein
VSGCQLSQQTAGSHTDCLCLWPARSLPPRLRMWVWEPRETICHPPCEAVKSALVVAEHGGPGGAGPCLLLPRAEPRRVHAEATETTEAWSACGAAPPFSDGRTRVEGFVAAVARQSWSPNRKTACRRLFKQQEAEGLAIPSPSAPSHRRGLWPIIRTQDVIFTKRGDRVP